MNNNYVQFPYHYHSCTSFSLVRKQYTNPVVLLTTGEHHWNCRPVGLSPRWLVTCCFTDIKRIFQKDRNNRDHFYRKRHYHSFARHTCKVLPDRVSNNYRSISIVIAISDGLVNRSRVKIHGIVQIEYQRWRRLYSIHKRFLLIMHYTNAMGNCDHVIYCNLAPL